MTCALQDILFILGANLAQIEERWDSGRLRASGLSSQHVGSLVSMPCQAILSTLSALLAPAAWLADEGACLREDRPMMVVTACSILILL